jgi:outer membrane protein OmpA-like peptidoglycan-associated protein
MNRRLSRRRSLQTLTCLTLGTLTGAAVGTWSSHAGAQTAPGFALDRFEPSETGSEWFANDTLDLRGNWRPALGVVTDYGYKPYVLLNPDGSENTAVITDQMVLHVGGSLVLLDRLRLAVSLPIAVQQEVSPNGGLVNGQRVVDSGGAGVGDLRAAVDLRLVGRYGDPFTLGFGGRIWFPTGDQATFLGDGQVRVGPHVSVAGDLGAFAYAASVGVIYRGNDQPFAGHATGSEADFSVAAGVRAVDKKLLIGPELSGTTIVSDSSAVFGSRTTPLAILGSAHYSAGDVRFGLGAGPGLSHAAGTAAFRGLLSIEYAPQIAEPPPPPEPLPPPPVVVEPPSDRDHDGIVDAEDACPDVAGVRTDDPRTNGCPSDRDRDTVYDTEDACPDVPGIRTSDPKTNGCPSDRDHDGIPDTLDACPDVAGPANPDPRKNGCPLAFVKDNQIQITEQINFRFGLADLDPVSDPILDAVLKVMQAHTEIPKIRVEGHTDNRGTSELNKRLSDARAAAVVSWLVKRGIDRSHLTSVGFGMDRPIDTNDTDAGRANNRRVEFHIEGEGLPKP